MFRSSSERSRVNCWADISMNSSPWTTSMKWCLANDSDIVTKSPQLCRSANAPIPEKKNFKKIALNIWQWQSQTNMQQLLCLFNAKYDPHVLKWKCCFLSTLLNIILMWTLLGFWGSVWHSDSRVFPNWDCSYSHCFVHDGWCTLKTLRHSVMKKTL